MSTNLSEINSLIQASDFIGADKRLSELTPGRDIPLLLYKQKKDEIKKLLSPSTLPIKEQPSAHGFPPSLIDITDIVYWFHHHQTLSGIQRLVVGTLNEFKTQERQTCHLISFISTDPAVSHAEPIVVDWHLLDSMADLAGGVLAGDHFKAYFYSYMAKANPLSPASDLTRELEWLLIPGAAWASESFPLAQKTLAKRLNLLIASIIYDIIPYSRPAFCVPALGRDFQVYLKSIAGISDILIPISEYVANQLRWYSTSLFSNLFSWPQIKSVPLARQVPLECHSKSVENAEETNLDAVDWENFILNVGTIEIRKNHISLFVAWRHMAEILGDRCPQLVIVGREGWHVESFTHLLGESNNLNGKITILHGLPDSDLAKLYSKCRFTVYPSVEEGWGLPIGESLDAGKVCISSSRASMTEAGLDLCIYVDPYEPLEMADKVIWLLQNPEIVISYEERIHSAKPFRSWHDYKEDLADVLLSCTNHHGLAMRNTPVNGRACPNIILRDGEVVTYYQTQSDGYNQCFLASAEAQHCYGERDINQKSQSLINKTVGRNIVKSEIFGNEPDGVWARSNTFSVGFNLNSDKFLNDTSNKLSIQVAVHYELFQGNIANFEDINCTFSASIGRHQSALTAAPEKTRPVDQNFPGFEQEVLELKNLIHCDKLVMAEFECHSEWPSLIFYPENVDTGTKSLLSISFEMKWPPGLTHNCPSGRVLQPVKLKEICARILKTNGHNKKYNQLLH